jgi:cell division protein FtsI/penicillin-binding protein 2
VLVAAAGLLFALLSLWLRVAWLQLARHAYYTERAERNQEQRVLVNPVRGDLLDRCGRRLATDVVTYSLSAVPREMADASHTARDLAALLKLEPRPLVREFVARPRYLMIQRHLPPEVAQRISDWQRRGLYLSVETERAYPLGAVSEELVGRTDVDHNGVEGIELALDGELRGQPGWITQFRTGRGGVFALPRGLKRSPTDGRDVTLTIDADLQSIVEAHLARAADTLNAERAFAIFLDPSSGEILAAVSVPHRANGQGRNWPFTDQYEPGSTFKVVTAAAALEDNVVAPDEYFDAGNGTCQIVPGTFFHDTHKRAGLTFRDAMRYSSNIVMAKIALKVGPERLYREATSFGFGSLTGIQFPGETAGRLRSPEHWSGRSCPTIAIGHEVTVTPLQLALGYAAIANGGVLMQPRLVREVRDARGNLVRRESPQALHRVFSEGTARTLCAMLQSVVLCRFRAGRSPRPGGCDRDRQSARQALLRRRGGGAGVSRGDRGSAALTAQSVPDHQRAVGGAPAAAGAGERSGSAPPAAAGCRASPRGVRPARAAGGSGGARAVADAGIRRGGRARRERDAVAVRAG